MGVDPKSIVPVVAQAPDRAAFQALLFSKIVPNCKKLGLLGGADGWLRTKFTELGVIEFESWTDTSEEYDAFASAPPKDRVALQPALPTGEEHCTGSSQFSGEELWVAGTRARLTAHLPSEQDPGRGVPSEAICNYRPCLPLPALSIANCVRRRRAALRHCLANPETAQKSQTATRNYAGEHRAQ